MTIGKWEFREEIKSVAASCVGVKPETARRKARVLFEKYEEIIAYDKSDREYWEVKSRKYQKLFEIYKSGRVIYKDGFLRLDEIESITSTSDIINVRMKSGEVQPFDREEWYFLLEI